MSEQANTCASSTTWAWRRVKVAPTLAPQAARPAKPGRFAGLSKRNPRDRLTLTITYRGGAQAWWLVEARGRHAVFSGVLCLQDVMAEINRDPNFYSH